MSKIGKIQNNSGKTSTHRSENIFLKYLLYNVHEIARKYPREKKRYSSFSDSVVDFGDCCLKKTWLNQATALKNLANATDLFYITL
jgi:hypothetical protein